MPFHLGTIWSNGLPRSALLLALGALRHNLPPIIMLQEALKLSAPLARSIIRCGRHFATDLVMSPRHLPSSGGSI